MTKSPLHSDWRECSPTYFPQLGVCSLDERAAPFILRKPVSTQQEQGFGRNITLFEALRHLAYRGIRHGWPNIPDWLRICEDQALRINERFDGSVRPPPIEGH